MKKLNCISVAIFLAVLFAISSHAFAQQREEVLTPDIVCRLEMGEPLFFIPPGAPDGKVKMLVTNNSGGIIHGKLLTGIRSKSTQPKTLQYIRDFSIPGGGTVEWSVPASSIGNELGVRYIDWQFVTQDQSYEGRNSFSVMDPVGVTPGIDKNGDGFIFGIAGGMRISRDYEYKKTFFRAAGIIGCEAYRVDLSWNNLQPSENEWRWKGLDELVEQAELNGMFIQPLLAYGNGWALSESDKIRAKEIYDRLSAVKNPGRPVHSLENVSSRMLMREDAWKNLCTQLANRYGTKMQYYEIWNEADMSDNFWFDNEENYVKLLKWSHEAIKAVNPDILVTTSGFATTRHPYRNQKVVDETFSSGRDYFDVIAWHQHGIFNNFQRGLDNELFPNIAKFNLTGRRTLFNETGLGIDRFEREWEQAATLLKKRVFIWSKGSDGHMWYNLQRSHPQYVMVNSDWSPRAVYPAFNELSRQLRGRKFVQSLSVGSGRWSYMFHGKGTFTGQSDKDYVITSWVEDAGISDYPAVFAVGKNSRAYEIDLMGNRKEIKVNNGNLVSVIEKDPKYLIIENSDIRPVCTGALFEVNNIDTKLVAGSENKIIVKVNNPLTEPSMTTIRVAAPSSVRLAGPSIIKSTLNPNESKEITFLIKHSSNIPDLTIPFTVECSVNEGIINSSSLIRMPVAFNIPSSSTSLAQPQFVLDKLENIVNNANILPGTDDLAWKGEKDLSARIWLSGSLEANIEVTDDKHFQTGENDKILSGDCVVISLALPASQGMYSFVISTVDKKSADIAVLETPDAIENKETLLRNLKASVKESSGKMTYQVILPLEAMNMTEEQKKSGLLFNVVVHDSDEKGYEGLIKLSTTDQRDPGGFATLLIQSSK